MRVAIIHDWLTTYTGAERVLEQLLVIYPKADLFVVCDFLPAAERRFLGGRRPHTTFIQRLPLARKHYRGYLPLMPLAVEQFDLSGYDLVISSSHAVAKGVLTGPDQLHVSYVYTPIRYAWDLQHQYLRAAGLERGVASWAARYLLHRMRLWDARTANGVDDFIACSAFIARRIKKVYRREATVIYPPVDIEAFPLQEDKDDYYLAASRMVPYKRIDLIVKAFAGMPRRRLKVAGDGPEMKKIRRFATGHDNIELLGYLPAAELVKYMAGARAFLFAAEEDFGIMPVEAQACGTPVIAYGRGGVCETVYDGSDGKPVTGCFFGEQTVGAIVEAVERFEHEGGAILPAACRENAMRFSVSRFRDHFTRHMKGDVSNCRGSGFPVSGKPCTRHDCPSAQPGLAGKVWPSHPAP
jgi:glycosyltransferase involved in cell wall biosynthesis